MTVPVQDPFADPAPTSQRPSIASLRGRLVMLTPRKIETVASNMNPGQMEDRATVDVTVVDGLGPVPQIKNNAPTGVYLEGPDFTGMWISNTRVVDQMRPFVGTGRSVLGVIETWKPGQQAIKGNPWGIITATPEQKQQAIAFLASRTVSGAAAPAPAPQPQAAPVYPIQATQTPAPVYGAPNPFAAAPSVPVQAASPQQAGAVTTAAAPIQAPAPQTAPSPPAVPVPGSAPAGVNPFA